MGRIGTSRAGRGAAFTAADRQVLSVIDAQPDVYPEVYGDVREGLVRGYPYAVSYRPELTVFPTSRAPAEWQKHA